MDRDPVHRPPPAPIVAALVRAGLSPATAQAMEAWKAREVLDLLHGTRMEVTMEPAGPGRGSI